MPELPAVSRSRRIRADWPVLWRLSAGTAVIMALRRGGRPNVGAGVARRFMILVAKSAGSRWWTYCRAARVCRRFLSPARQVNLVKAIAQRAQAGPSARGGPETAEAATCPLAMTVNLADSPDHVVSLVSQIATVVELPTPRTMTSQIPRIVRRTLADVPLSRRPTGFSTGALHALMRWDWPGNFTEMRRTVEQLAGREMTGVHALYRKIRIHRIPVT